MDDQQALELRWVAIRDQLEAAYGRCSDRLAVPFGVPPMAPTRPHGSVGPDPLAWMSALEDRRAGDDKEPAP